MKHTHKPGYKHTSLGWIPDEWEVRKLDDISYKIGDGLHGTPKYVDKSEYYFINGNNLTNDKIMVDESTKCVSRHEYLRHRKELREGSILISINGTIGNLALYLGESIVLGKSAAYISCKEGYTNYIYHVLKSDSIYRFFENELTGSTIRNLSLKTLRETPIPIPSAKEQQKITTILTTWDEAIQKTQQLIEQLKQRNKALMQQLMSGKKRLKGFGGKWHEYIFDDCFRIIRSYSLSREYLSQQNEIDSIYCIHYGDIHALYKTIFLDFDTEKRIPQIINQNFVLKEEDYLVDGDIIMADASEDYEGVGEAVEVINLNDKKAVGGLHTIVIRETKDLTHRGFLAFLFDSENVRNELRKKATGTSVYSISKATLKSLTFKLPELDEQKAIADFLSKSLTELKLYEEQLITLQQQKKGLMQKLLSGEVRVKNF